MILLPTTQTVLSTLFVGFRFFNKKNSELFVGLFFFVYLCSRLVRPFKIFSGEAFSKSIIDWITSYYIVDFGKLWWLKE